jgi:signal transduction histidine kinase
LWFGEEAVKLTVSDQGRGFEVPERLRMLTEAGHFGLVSMYERLELVGGTLHLTSEPGQGTMVAAWVSSRPDE